MRSGRRLKTENGIDPIEAGMGARKWRRGTILNERAEIRQVIFASGNRLAVYVAARHRPMRGILHIYKHARARTRSRSRARAYWHRAARERAPHPRCFR